MISAQWLSELSAKKQREHSKWSERAWENFAGSAAVALAQALDACAWEQADKEAVFKSFIELGSEALGLSYIGLTPQGQEKNFSSWLWEEFLPYELSKSPSGKEASRFLALSWNLTENISLGEPWLEFLFAYERRRLSALSSLSEFVHSIELLLNDSKTLPLRLSAGQGEFEMHPVSLRTVERNALPNRVCFLAPNLLQIADRFSGLSYLVLLRPEPLILSQMKGEADDTWIWNTEASAIFDGHKSMLGELRGVSASSHYAVAVPSLSQRVYVAWMK